MEEEEKVRRSHWPCPSSQASRLGENKKPFYTQAEKANGPGYGKLAEREVRLRQWKTSHCILVEEWQGKYERLSSAGSKDIVYTDRVRNSEKY